MSDTPVPATGTRPVAPEDVLNGTKVGVGRVAYCTDCYATLRSGEPIGLYAYRLADSPHWDVARLYCHDCAPDGFTGPTLGAIEVLCSAELCTRSSPTEQTHQLCLSNVTQERYAGPDDGTEP